MKFPYGISDFKKITTKGYFYCDRTRSIPLLEKSESQLFIRPRRFGKSLLLSMLENYYDLARKDQFDEIFGNLAIAQSPTKLRNSFYILRWDFSCVDTTGGIDAIKKSLYNHLNVRMEGLIQYYTHRGYDLPPVKINYDDALYTMDALLNAVKSTPYPVYLLIDEYDNFANTILMGVHKDKERYDALVHDEGILRTLFKAIKSSTSGTGFDRVFITGVSPVVLSDITSGYNIAKNIYFHPNFNALCGFTQKEVRSCIKTIVDECGWATEKIDEAVDLMRTYYNGYCFSPVLTAGGEPANSTDLPMTAPPKATIEGKVTEKIAADHYVYNPTLCLFFFEQFHEMCSYPREMLDDNLATDESKLEYIAQIPAGRELLLKLTQKSQEVSIPAVSKRFGIREMLSDGARDNTFLISFLYYFGVLTLAGENDAGEVSLKVPNLVVQSLYVERVQKMLLPEPMERDNGKFAAKQVYQKGDMAPLCRFMEKHLFSVLSNRDYRWANELTLKSAFLSLLYNDILYIMDSEPETGRDYADLTMIIRPDKRKFSILDVLIEFKFIPLKAAGLSGDQAKSLSQDELLQLPKITSALDAGEAQVIRYGRHLEKKYNNLRLRKFVVAALGFERVCFKAI